VGFFCNIFHGCVQAREDASSELPDVIHKLWSIVISNPKSDILINTMQMLVSLTSNCPSGKYYFGYHNFFFTLFIFYILNPCLLTLTK
jgi:hypothetical protein